MCVYTDVLHSVDLGGRRIIKKKKTDQRAQHILTLAILDTRDTGSQSMFHSDDP
jgi:hypothetical protein